MSNPTKEQYAADNFEPQMNPDWDRLQREWAIGGLRVLNEMINSANLIGAKEVTVEALVKKRDAIEIERKANV